MANIKISELETANTVSSDDILMIVHGTRDKENNVVYTNNKKLSLQNLLGHLDSPVTINSQLENLSLVVNGSSPNLLCTNALTNSVGILTNNPENATLHVLGDIRAGGYTSLDKTIVGVTVGADNSWSSGYKKVTITVSESISGFTANDTIYIYGLNISALNGYKVIGDDGVSSFKYKVPNSTDVTGLDETPSNAYSQKFTYKPGTFKSSIEQIVHDSGSGTKSIGSSFSVTGLTINGTTTFTLSQTGGIGQEKIIYVKAVTQVGDKATFNNINGYGFNKIQFTKVGDSITLKYDGEKWVCLNTNGAITSTV